jgi:DNA-binding Xre family transcriptional regulator
MLSLNSFIDRNSFKKNLVLELVNNLGVTLISAGNMQLLSKGDASTIRSAYLEKYPASK